MAEKYDYRKAIRDDLKDMIEENGYLARLSDFSDRDELEERINDDAWMDDSVTGNASGSYTFSAWQAEENLCHNLDLLAEALSEFGYDGKLDMDKGAEHYDVTIRCYLLGQLIGEVLDELGIEEDDERFSE